MERVFAGLTEIFRDVFERDDLVIKPTDTAADIKGWDSLKQVEIIIAVQEQFGVKLSSREVDTLANVGDLAMAIDRRLQR
jgi:acyl carrier protein